MTEVMWPFKRHDRQQRELIPSPIEAASSVLIALANDLQTAADHLIENASSDFGEVVPQTGTDDDSAPTF